MEEAKVRQPLPFLMSCAALRFSNGFENYVLLETFYDRPGNIPSTWRRIEPSYAPHQIESVFLGTWDRSDELWTFLMEQSSHFAQPQRGAIGEGRREVLRRQLQRLFGRMGSYALFEDTWRPQRHLRPARPSEEEEPETAAQKDAWLAFELVDEDGAPMPRIASELVVEGGRGRRLRTNSAGHCKLPSMRSGSCELSWRPRTSSDWRSWH